MGGHVRWTNRADMFWGEYVRRTFGTSNRSDMSLCPRGRKFWRTSNRISCPADMGADNFFKTDSSVLPPSPPTPPPPQMTAPSVQKKVQKNFSGTLNCRKKLFQHFRSSDDFEREGGARIFVSPQKRLLNLHDAFFVQFEKCR